MSRSRRPPPPPPPPFRSPSLWTVNGKVTAVTAVGPGRLRNRWQSDVPSGRNPVEAQPCDAAALTIAEMVVAILLTALLAVLLTAAAATFAGPGRRGRWPHPAGPGGQSCRGSLGPRPERLPGR